MEDSLEKIENECGLTAKVASARHDADLASLASDWQRRLRALRERDEKRWEMVRLIEVRLRDACEPDYHNRIISVEEDVIGSDQFAGCFCHMADRLREAREGK